MLRNHVSMLVLRNWCTDRRRCAFWRMEGIDEMTQRNCNLENDISWYLVCTTTKWNISKHISKILYFSTSPLHHPVLSHHHVYVDFYNNLLTALPVCALVKLKSDRSITPAQNPSMASLLTKIKAKVINIMIHTPPGSLLPLWIYSLRCPPSSFSLL